MPTEKMSQTCVGKSVMEKMPPPQKKKKEKEKREEVNLSLFFFYLTDFNPNDRQTC